MNSYADNKDVKRGKRPVSTVRIGVFKVLIWENRIGDRTWHNKTFTKIELKRLKKEQEEKK